MATEDESLDAAVRHQVAVERYKSSEHREAEEESSLIEEAALAALLALGFQSAGELKKKEMVDLSRLFRSIGNDSFDSYFRKLNSRLDRFASIEARFEQRNLANILGRRIKPATDPLSYILNLPMGHSGESVSQFIGRWKTNELNKLGDFIRKGWVEDAKLQDMIRAIKGTRANKFSDGWKAQYNRRAQAQIDTIIQHYSNVAKESVWIANKDLIDRYKWVSVLDSRTTPICRSLAGKIFDVGLGPLPPQHYRCRSTVIALPKGT